MSADAAAAADRADAAADNWLVFVYGTLKTGQPNSARLREYMGRDIGVVGNAVTKHPYPLVIATEYNVPFMINEICFTAKKVTGELLRVSSKALAFLDYIESVPTLYVRERIEVDMVRPEWEPPPLSLDAGADAASTPASSEAARWCWCYFLAHHNPSLVAPPFYSEYDSAKTPLRVDVDSLTPQQEERIRRCIAKQAQIVP